MRTFKGPFLISKRRDGMALLVVVVLVMLIALGAYRFSFYMESQYRLTRLHEEQVQARLASQSGIEVAASLIERSSAERRAIGGLINNPSLFQHVEIDPPVDAGLEKEQTGSWRFGLISPKQLSDSSSIGSNGDQSGLVAPMMHRFGFENESAKLHIPTLLQWERAHPGHARLTLMGLPGMNEQVVDSWLRDLGVTSGPISQLSPMGTSSQSAIESNESTHTQDALLALWYGNDLNQNYRLDPIEQLLSQRMIAGQDGGPLTGPSQGRSPQVNSTQAALATLGQTSNTGAVGRPIASDGPIPLQRYLTWLNGQRNESKSGQVKINLNDPNLQTLHQKLLAIWPSDKANFVIALRQYGPGNGSLISSQVNATDSNSQTSRSPNANEPAQNIVLPSKNASSPTPSSNSPSSASSSPPASIPQSALPASPRTFSPAPQGLATAPQGLSTAPQGLSSPTPIGTAQPPSSSSTTTPPVADTILSAENWAPDFSFPASYSLKSVLELAEAVVDLPSPPLTTNTNSVTSSSTSTKQRIRNPFSGDLLELRNYLGKILDETTIDAAPSSVGRVDISEAPLEVLAGVPGLDLSLAQRILEQRSASTNGLEPKETIAWLFESGLVDLGRLKSLEPYLTCRSDVYTVQSIGYRDSLRPVFRTTATIDARQLPAKIRNQRIWHPWDRGFPIEELIQVSP